MRIDAPTKARTVERPASIASSIACKQDRSQNQPAMVGQGRCMPSALDATGVVAFRRMCKCLLIYASVTSVCSVVAFSENPSCSTYCGRHGGNRWSVSQWCRQLHVTRNVKASRSIGLPAVPSGRGRSETILTLMASSSGDADFTREDDNNNNNHESSSTNRPDWAPDWAPTSLVTMRPIVQLFVALLLYVFHLTVLTQHQLVFPVQLIPNDRGWAQSIGLDSLAGMASFAGMLWLRKTTKHRDTPAVPPVLRSPKGDEMPWAFSASRLLKTGAKNSNELSGLTPRATSLVVFLMLTYTYFHTGQFSLWCERFLYELAGVGVPLTVAMQRSLVVLLGHLGWVVAGSAILRFALRPQPFFGGGWVRPKLIERIRPFFQRRTMAVKGRRQKQPADVKWYTNKWDTYWLWWTIGGYFVSSWVFNIADFVNQCVLPAAIFEAQPEGVVSQLINPENNDVAASIVGYIAPCISAPWWEEVLYRGFMLPALCLHFGYWPAVYASGIIFSAHHMSWTGG